MERNINLVKRYINIPVKKSSAKALVTIKDSGGHRLLRYFSVSPADGKHDFIANYDMAEFTGQELIFEVGNDEIAEIFFSGLTQSEEPAGLDGVYQEEYRPQFHFSPKRGRLNDPNGLFYYNGQYHMFYQYNPFGTNWANMHWGHAVSKDLMHWREKDVVLYPDETGSMYSGGAVVDWNNTSGLQEGEYPPIILFYTAAGKHAPVPCEYTQCIAYSVDGGITFRKYHKNPVVGAIAWESRDPKVAWHEESKKWVMALYRGDEELVFNLLTSDNLLEWHIEQTIEIPGGRECPEFFPLPLDGCESNMKWIFMTAGGRYLAGSFDGRKFEPEAGPFDSFIYHSAESGYAGQVWSDAPDNRKIMLCWQRGECQAPEFNQTMTIPVELSLKTFSGEARLCAEPVKEFNEIRDRSWEFKNIEMKSLDCTPDEFLQIPEGNTWDIELELDENCDLTVKICGEDITFDTISREIRLSAETLHFPGTTADFNVRIIVDRASIEIFSGNGRIWYSKRKLTISTPPLIFANHGKGKGLLKNIKIHRINSIWR